MRKPRVLVSISFGRRLVRNSRPVCVHFAPRPDDTPIPFLRP